MWTLWNRMQREPTRAWRVTGEFVVVWGEFGSLRVSRAVGAWIADMTGRRVRPAWLEFVDVVGSLIRVRTGDVHGLYDSTPRQRARMKAHNESLEYE